MYATKMTTLVLSPSLLARAVPKVELVRKLACGIKTLAFQAQLQRGAFCDTRCIYLRQRSNCTSLLQAHIAARAQEHAATPTKNGEASRELPAPVSRSDCATADADQIKRPAGRR